MSDRQYLVNSAGAKELPLLVADIYEAAALLRRVGDVLAHAESQTQARWQLLSVISDHGRTVPQAARRLGVSRQAVQRVANDLAEAGLVVFRPNPEHRASPVLDLTPSGREVLQRIDKRAARFHEELALPFHSEEIDLAHRVLRALVEQVAAVG